MFFLIYFFFWISVSASSISFIYYIFQKDIELLKDEPEKTLVLDDVKIDEKYEDKYLVKVKNLMVNNRDEIDLSKYKHLKNNFVLEKTPVGNVAMYFDHESETFTYYSDNTIPYRFLEVIARKYVLTFKCVDLYVDMNKELELIEIRKVEQEEKQKKKEKENENENENEKKTNSEKKNVFAQFKTYNKEGGSGRVNSVAPPQNSITTASSNAAYNPLLLKERANRYVCKGRFSNFPILKQVSRKKIDKDYALSFSEYKKKMLLNKKP